MKKYQLTLISLLIVLSSFQLNGATSIKVALILDTSNSMDGLIDQAKTQLWNVVNELSMAKCNGETPNLQIALYEYGNDRLPMREGYIRLVTPFTGDLDLISEKLFALKTNGGSEYCGQVIAQSLKELDWENYPNDLKLIFIAGNEPFNQGNVDYREVCKSTRDKDITVNTIFCGNFEEGERAYWKDGAYISGGDYMNIDQDCNYVYIKTPYDDQIMTLNGRLNKTYIAYGSDRKIYEIRQVEQDKNAFAENEEFAIKRAATKSKSFYKNSHWDLVDASMEANFDIENIPVDQLPEELQNMTLKERKAYITEMKKEREQIKNEINELSQKRDQYIAQKRTEDADNVMLDKAIIHAVKKQAKNKNFQFKK